MGAQDMKRFGATIPRIKEAAPKGFSSSPEYMEVSGHETSYRGGGPGSKRDEGMRYLGVLGSMI